MRGEGEAVSEIIKQMKKAAKAIKKWPASMKRMRKMRLQAEEYLEERKSNHGKKVKP